MERQAFVARRRELEQLDGFLSRSLAGQGQVCFVTGEAGSGKTALVTEFARRAQEEHEDLVVAVGQSDAQTGVGDPYLPFREVLSQLTGDVDAKLAQGAITEENAGRLRRFLRLSGQALVEAGPDLIGILVPAAGLVARVGTFAAKKIGWLENLEQVTRRPRESLAPEIAGIEQGHIFEQYTNVLRALAARQPLMLVLDDLQWADAASIGLLFRLGRRIEGSRILIVGTYRPDEVAIGRAGERHPLEKVLAEFKRYFGEVCVDLAQAEEAEGQRFVDAFLDSEPTRLGKGFRRALYLHSGGHPLFTIELLRDMQERGDIVRDEQGRWVEGPSLNWEVLPARVEGVIQERIGRLEQELREALTVASVEGEDFTAEIVARVQATDARRLVQRLSGELAKQHRLVRARGVRRLETQRLSLYRFWHNLFQKYLYDELDEVERAVLHEDVGSTLEELYGDQVDEIAVQLARHFAEAGITEKAAYYLLLAGEQAAAKFANAEAVAYFSRALDLTSQTDTAGRYVLLLARERVYSLRGERDSQKQDLAVLKGLAGSLDDQQRAEVALREAHYSEVIADYPATITATQAAIRLAQAAQDVSSEAVGYRQWGRALLRQGNYAAARVQLEQALALASCVGLRQVEAGSLTNLGSVSLYQGDHAGAKGYYEQTLRVSREIGDRRGEGRAFADLGNVSSDQGDYTEARVYYEQALLVFRGVGDRQGEAMVLVNLGFNSDRHGDYAGARAYLEQALRIFREIGDRRGEGWVLSNLGLLSHHLGDDKAARGYGEQALLIAQDLGHRHLHGYASTTMGHALAAQGHLAEAADAYQQALILRRELRQPSLATEILAGLARVSLAEGDLTQAQAQVAEILSHLDSDTLAGTDEPFRVYLTCYRVLQAGRDSRSQDVLNTAHSLLQEQAGKINDEEVRRSFLEKVASHREILSEHAKGE